MRKIHYLYITAALSLAWIAVFRPLYPFLIARVNNKSPQLIMVLGGDVDREIAGIKIAKQLNLPILISGGSNPQYSNWLIEQEDLPPSLLRRDYRAKDTLTNFTSIVDELSQEKVNHILLVTSSYHINRAKVVGEIITSSRGIRLTSLSVPCHSYCQQENKRKKRFDYLRALAWVTIGKDLKDMVPQSIKNKIKD